jgi:hypothetical protein
VLLNLPISDIATDPVFAPHPRCARCGECANDRGGKEKHRNPAGRRMSDVWNGPSRLRSRQKAWKANELPLELVLRWALTLPVGRWAAARGRGR